MLMSLCGTELSLSIWKASQESFSKTLIHEIPGPQRDCESRTVGGKVQLKNALGLSVK